MIWKFFKTSLSLLLSIIVASSVLDFLRKPVLPNDVLNTALYDLDNQPFFLPQLAQDRPTILHGAVIVVTSHLLLIRWRDRERR